MMHGEEERQTEVWSGADMQRLGVPLPSWRETTSGGLCRSVIMVQTESSLLQYVVTATAVQCRAGLLPRRLFASSQSVENFTCCPMAVLSNPPPWTWLGTRLRLWEAQLCLRTAPRTTICTQTDTKEEEGVSYIVIFT